MLIVDCPGLCPWSPCWSGVSCMNMALGLPPLASWGLHRESQLPRDSALLCHIPGLAAQGTVTLRHKFLGCQCSAGTHCRSVTGGPSGFGEVEVHSPYLQGVLGSPTGRPDKGGTGRKSPRYGQFNQVAYLRPGRNRLQLQPSLWLSPVPREVPLLGGHLIICSFIPGALRACSSKSTRPANYEQAEPWGWHGSLNSDFRLPAKQVKHRFWYGAPIQLAAMFSFTAMCLPIQAGEERAEFLSL